MSSSTIEASTSDPGEQSERRAPGIVERLVRDDVDRKRFLKMVGGTGAASFSAFALAACGSSSKSSSSAGAPAATASASTTGSNSGDLAILNYALTLEYLETSFYEKVVASGLFSGKVAGLIKTFGGQEKTHVEAHPGRRFCQTG